MCKIFAEDWKLMKIYGAHLLNLPYPVAPKQVYLSFVGIGIHAYFRTSTGTKIMNFDYKNSAFLLFI